MKYFHNVTFLRLFFQSKLMDIPKIVVWHLDFNFALIFVRVMFMIVLYKFEPSFFLFFIIFEFCLLIARLLKSTKLILSFIINIYNNKQWVNPKSFYFNSHLHIFLEMCGPFKSSFSFWVWKVKRKCISTLINISS